MQTVLSAASSTSPLPQPPFSPTVTLELATLCIVNLFGASPQLLMRNSFNSVLCLLLCLPVSSPACPLGDTLMAAPLPRGLPRQVAGADSCLSFLQKAAALSKVRGMKWSCCKLGFSRGQRRLDWVDMVPSVVTDRLMSLSHQSGDQPVSSLCTQKRTQMNE